MDFITGRRAAELETAEHEIGAAAVIGVQSDISLAADLDRLFSTIRQAKGRLDVLFANTGIGALAPLGAITEEHVDRLFDINVRGTLFTVKKGAGQRYAAGLHGASLGASRHALQTNVNE